MSFTEIPGLGSGGVGSGCGSGCGSGFGFGALASYCSKISRMALRTASDDMVAPVTASALPR